MPPTKALGIQDVARLLHLSLDEVLDYVSLGYLPPVEGRESSSYRFSMDALRAFAQRYLGITLADFDPLPTPADALVALPPSPSFTIEVREGDLLQGGVIQFDAYERAVRTIEEQKTALVRQYANYREQVGYRIGQLETLLDVEKQRTGDQDEKMELLKRKLIEARAERDAATAELTRKKNLLHRLFGRR